MTRSLMTAALTCGAMLATTAGTAHARTHEFTGACTYSGTVAFDDPIGAVPAPNEMTFRARGTCTGQIDSREVVDATTTWNAKTTGTMSCANGLPGGAGTMTVDGTDIGFSFTEMRLVSAGLLHFEGDAGGSLDGIGSTDDDIGEAAAQCTAGELEQVGVTARLSGSIAG